MKLFGSYAARPVRRLKGPAPPGMRQKIIRRRKETLRTLAMDAIQEGARDHEIRDALVLTTWKRNRVILWPDPRIGVAMFYRGEHVATFEPEDQVSVRLRRTLGQGLSRSA